MPSIGSIGMRVEFRTSGLEDIRAKMLALKKDVALKIIRKGLKAGASVIQEKAVRNLQSNMSVRTGALIQSVIVRSGRANAPNRLGGYEEWAGVTIAPTVFEARLDEGLFRTLAVKAKRGRAPRGTIKPRAYAHLVEFGVRPHATGKGSKLDEVVQVSKRGKKGRTQTQTVLTGRKGKQHGRMHPGVPERPFMRPAFDSGRFQAAQALQDTVRSELNAVLTRFEKQPRRRSA